MTSLEPFESALKDVVKSKKVSESKMKKLTEIALACMDHDTPMVSLLYRTHKALPASSKVPSLYAFDALARAARHRANKQQLTGGAHSGSGNCATFLSKLESVLDSLLLDMSLSAGPEGKEKSKKIVDIWVKANTFPSAVLTRLTNVLKDSDKGAYLVSDICSLSTSSPRNPSHASISTRNGNLNSATSIDPTQSASVTPTAPGPFVPASQTHSQQIGVDPSVQSTLLALLTQAANAIGGQTNGQTTTNTNPLPPVTNQSPALPLNPQLDANQLQLIQQLAQAAKLGTAGPSVQPVPLQFSSVPALPSTNPPAVEPRKDLGQRSLSYRDDRYASCHSQPKYGRRDEYERGRDREDYYDDHRDRPRGGYRGRGRGRWDDRREEYRDDGGDRSPSYRRRSRSRSPHRGRYGGRRDVKPYSPPQRTPMAPVVARELELKATEASSSNSGKDEFGRDIRASEVGTGSNEQGSRSPHPAARSEVSASLDGNHPLKPPQSTLTTPTTVSSNADDYQNSVLTGLETFDFATFDPTAPTSWEALGKLWQVTHGYQPSQEELMAFIMSGGMTDQSSLYMQQGYQGADQEWVGGLSDGGNAQRGGGSPYNDCRGGTLYGNNRQGQEQWSYRENGHKQDSEAVGESHWSDHDGTGGQAFSENEKSGTARGTSAGRMQRVGDKWVFVRAGAAS
ncbi:hypothetical protein EW146_g5424 [Bondarzewia mesenterica]|uniref:CID domain-containing protein n=1 Tax=Bondarzewia mesenterica TaxID=1095465 RepID=A0A4S4LXB4_9AGAM|nr:hypothetical protein EW146_g5424 [Bondarzewia mesenterica]